MIKHFVVLIALLVASPSFAEEEKRLDPAIVMEVLRLKDDEIIFGKKDAPITVVEYSSLTCPHCSTFHTTAFPDILSKYIETGKVKWIRRDFTLDGPSLRGAMLIYCAPDDQKENFVKVLMKKQASWAYTKHYIEMLENIAKLGGVDGKAFHKCINDKKIEDKFLKSLTEAGEKLDIRGTPAFFVNDKRERSYSFVKFSSLFDRLLADKKN